MVTGATGFTGRALTLALLKSDFDVRVIVRKTSNYHDLRERGCEIYFGDLITSEGLEEAVNGVETIYHIATVFRIEGVLKRYYFSISIGDPLFFTTIFG